MCVVALAHRAHPRWRLIVAGNRDELHARASAPLSRWEDGSGIIAGRDLVSGGSWLGVSDAGRFAVVTNLAGLRDPDPSKKSRGELVTWALKGQAKPTSQLGDYNPFCLLTVDGAEAGLSLNGVEAKYETIASGVYGLSNTLPAEPWPRRDALVETLRNWLVGSPDDPASLFDTLTDESLAVEGKRPIFIRDSIYGTRCSTIVAVDARGDGMIVERRYAPDGTNVGQTEVGFAWS